MSWFIVFFLIGGDGRIFAHDSVHGFASRADCMDFGSHIPVHNGVVRYECKQEDPLKPVIWYNDSRY
jgi:hypothetical protein